MGLIVVKSALRMLTLYMCFNESGISGSETIMYLNICYRYLIFLPNHMFLLSGNTMASFLTSFEIWIVPKILHYKKRLC